MEEIKVYNTLTGEKTVFRPLVPGEVKIYVCGVTPYNLCRILLMWTIRLSIRQMPRGLTGKRFPTGILMLISK